MTSLYTTTQTSNGSASVSVCSSVLPEGYPKPSWFELGKPQTPCLPGKEMTMPFAIYRHEKIKTAQALTASANHMTRAADTPNADPTRAALNRVLIGSADPAADAAALIPAPDAVDEGGKKRRRSNSVLAIEILLTACPSGGPRPPRRAAGLAGPLDGMAGPRVWPREHRPPAPPRRRADAPPHGLHRPAR